jgi:hypothetical protein
MHVADTLSSEAKEPRRCGFKRAAEVLSVMVFVLALGAALVSASSSGDERRESQVKSNLHEIQLAVERYAFDHSKQYPLYLIGGKGAYSIYVEGSAIGFMLVRDCADQALLSDPLLREGYLAAYPRNPFVSKGAAVQEFQMGRKDPLFNGSNVAVDQGTRFGPECTLMGNVLGDRRYPQATFTSDGTSKVYPTGADHDYYFYDIWAADKPRTYMPGNFFYRSSPLVPGEVVPKGKLRTDVARSYMLGGYGAVNTRGRDVVGPDPFGVNNASPFSLDDEGRLAYENPNGHPDGVILVLAFGKG